MGIEKREQIKYKIFHEQDINQLMDVFFSTEKELNHKETEVLYTIQFKDGTIASGSDRLTIDRNRSIQSIVFSLTNKSLHTSIAVDLYIDKNSSTYAVEGTHQEWVKEKSTQLQKIIDATPNQNQYLAHPVWRTGLSILLVLLIFSFMYLLIENYLSSRAGYAWLIVAVVWAHFWTGRLLGNNLDTLYPEVDFDTSIHRESKKRKQRTFLKLIVICFLIPLLVKFIVERMI